MVNRSHDALFAALPNENRKTEAEIPVAKLHVEPVNPPKEEEIIT